MEKIKLHFALILGKGNVQDVALNRLLYMLTRSVFNPKYLNNHMKHQRIYSTTVTELMPSKITV